MTPNPEEKPAAAPEEERKPLPAVFSAIGRRTEDGFMVLTVQINLEQADQVQAMGILETAKLDYIAFMRRVALTGAKIEAEKKAAAESEAKSIRKRFLSALGR